MCTITIQIPDEVLKPGSRSAEEFAREVQVAAAVRMFESGAVSQGRAAELAGLRVGDFLHALGRYKVSIWQLTPEEIEADLRSVP